MVTEPVLSIEKIANKTVVSARLTFDDFDEAMRFNDVVVNYLKPLLERQRSPFIEGYFTDRCRAGDRVDPATGVHTKAE